MAEPDLKALRATLAQKATQFAADPFWSLPAWAAVHARLCELLPSAATLLKPGSTGPDRILEVAEMDAVPFTSILIYNPVRPDSAGRGNKAWHDYRRMEIFDALFADGPLPPGQVWFVPRDCYRRREGPYSAPSEQLRQLVATCGCDFDPSCDSLFLWQQQPRISLVHHSGAFFHIPALSRS